MERIFLTVDPSKVEVLKDGDLKNEFCKIAPIVSRGLTLLAGLVVKRPVLRRVILIIAKIIDTVSADICTVK